jgi:2-deoxy-D-gluconate 3-dehydrogenase
MQRSIFSLDGKRALVVGGAGEIGYAIAAALLEFGAYVVIADKDPDTLVKAAVLKKEWPNCFGCIVDISDREQIDDSIINSVNLLGGSIEILVNAAGIQRRNPSEIFPENDWDALISVNLTSVFLYSKKVSIGMISNGFGKIINVCSIMSQFGGVNIPGYSASKGGVAQLTKAMSNDLARKGICINAISPGYIKTDMNSAILGDSERTAKILDRTPIGRWGEPIDLKGISVFLASNASDFITGAVIPVDGGYSGM